MIIGKIDKNGDTIKLDLDIFCNNCKKKVPGLIKTGKNYSKTTDFKIELDDFLKNYLCGICRDKKRVKKN